jgi:predicted cobalt transporter CbtA
VSRRPMPSEFGFVTGPYLPPPKPRSLWRTLLISALLALVPVVGPGISAVYVDRRDDPESFNFPQALVTAVIQLIALAVVALLFWLVFGVLLGFSLQLSQG